MRPQERQLEIVPPSLGSNSQKHPAWCGPKCAADRSLAARMGDDALAGGEEAIQVRFNQLAELLVDRDHRHACIARLLQPFEQQWAIAFRSQQMGVEIVAFHFSGIGQDDLSDTQCRQLGPQSPHDFWTWQRQQEVNSRALRSVAVEGALQRDPAVIDGRDRADAEWTVYHADADLLIGRHSQDVHQVSGLIGHGLNGAIRPYGRSVE